MHKVDSVRLVLKDYVRKEDLEQVARAERWILRKETLAQERKPYQRLWITFDLRTGICYAEDDLIRVRYIEVRSTELADAVSRLTRLVDVFNAAEILGLATMAANSAHLVDAVHKAAVAAPKEPEPRLLQIFQAAMRHPDPAVRIAAIEAVAYAGWQELAEPLAAMEADPQTGRQAAVMLQAMRTHHWRKEAA